MVLSALCFAAMGIMFASMPGQSPGQIISLFSPLTHTIELVRGGLGGENVFRPSVNVAVLSLYLALFLFLGIRFHIINQKRE